MLESLGYAEAERARRRRPDPLQHLLDPREGRRALRRAPAPRRARSSAAAEDVVIGVGGCWAQSVKDEVFRQFPFVDVAFGPGQVHKLAEFLTSDSLTAQGFFEFEGFTGPPAGQARARVPGLGADLRRLQLPLLYCIVPSTRGREVSRPLDELVAEVERLVGRRRPRGHAARAERQLLRRATCGRQRPLRSRAAARGRRGRRASTASATRARTRRTCARTSCARTPSCRASASTSTCRCSRGSTRVLKAMRRTYDRERYLDRVALIREHVPDCALTTDIIVGFPGETEADFAADARRLRAGRLRRRLHLHLLAAAGDRGGGAHRRARRARGRGRAHGAPRRGRPAPRARARPAVRRADARRARRGPVAHRPVPAARALAATARR